MARSAAPLALQQEVARLKRELAGVLEITDRMREDLRRSRREASQMRQPSDPDLSRDVRAVALMFDEFRSCASAPELPLVPRARERIAAGQVALGRLARESKAVRDARERATSGLAMRAADACAHWHALVDLLEVFSAKQARLVLSLGPEPPGVRNG